MSIQAQTNQIDTRQNLVEENCSVFGRLTAQPRK